jgi:hypothetical protein
MEEKFIESKYVLFSFENGGNRIIMRRMRSPIIMSAPFERDTICYNELGQNAKLRFWSIRFGFAI